MKKYKFDRGQVICQDPISATQVSVMRRRDTGEVITTELTLALVLSKEIDHKISHDVAPIA